MITIRREGYSKSFEFDSPEYFEEHENFTEIGDDIYRADMRGESALILYNEDTHTIDVVGDFNAVRGIQTSYRQQFGAAAGFNNGVGEHYNPQKPIESEAARKALKEFGVETSGLEPEEKEKQKVSVTSD